MGPGVTSKGDEFSVSVRLLVKKSTKQLTSLVAQHGEGLGKIVESLSADGLWGPSPPDHAAIYRCVPQNAVAILE